MDHENGILLLNLLADVWDLLEQYNLLYKESEMENESTHLKPTCTVMIKYMKDMNDIYFAHNAWHMYQAMSYRILKNYKLNYHVLPGSSVLIPGHTIAMSSYAGTVILYTILLVAQAFKIISHGLKILPISIVYRIWKNSCYNSYLFCD